MDTPTVGVEEEYLLLDAQAGAPAPRAHEVKAAAAGRPALAEGGVESELLGVQVEVGTPVCTGLDEVRDHLVRLRRELGAAAASQGCRLASVATSPLPWADPVPLGDGERYQAIHAVAPRLTDEQVLCGLHVHVGVPDRESGVRILDRLRGWLPVLLAVSASSPFWAGRDTGFASWRTLQFDRWPVSGPPPHFGSAQAYDRRTAALLQAGAVLDTGSLYWQARLSERYPTVEVRVCDAQLRVEDSVLLAGLVRALVTTALDGARRDVPAPRPEPELLRAAVWTAARWGLSGELLDPASQRPRPAGEVVDALLAHVDGALAASGDRARVHALLAAVRRDGTGAQRQRAEAERTGLPGVVDLVLRETAHVPDEGAAAG